MATVAAPDPGAVASATETWREAFVAVQRESDFAPLAHLLESRAAGSAGAAAAGVNAAFEWEGRFLTPLFVAVLLQLDDLLPKLLALGADPGVQCFHEGLLCTPLHAAALGLNLPALQQLLEFLGDGAAAQLAESLALPGGAAGGAPGPFPERQSHDLVGCNALHVLASRDVWSEEAYRLLLGGGVQLSSACKTRSGEEVRGLLLPRRFGNREATEERLDSVLGEEVKHLIRSARFANQLNAFLEMGSAMKREHGAAAYRCTKDVDFCLAGQCALAAVGQEQEAPTALLYAADVGNSDAMRLLLYAGADPTRTAQRVLPFEAHRAITLPAQAIHLALLRNDATALEHLFFFGVDPATVCPGDVHRAAVGVDVGEVEEHWEGLGLVHVAVLNRSPDIIADLLKRDCDINAVAARTVIARGAPPEETSPLGLAVLLSDVRCASKLLDGGAHVSECVRAAACAREAVCEMFGGPSVVGLEDWVAALLTGEGALQRLIDRRTDLSRVLDWPAESAAALLERHRLASPELVGRLVQTLEEVPTSLRGVCPVHLACLLQQPWALAMLAGAGAPVGDATPCREAARFESGYAEESGLASVPLDCLCLCARVGNLQMMELLCSDRRFALDVRTEIPLAPDLTPPFFARRPTELGPTWAWRRLGALELALLHRRVDAAVLLARLGADLLHTVDHVAVQPPSHYSVTDMCFRGLTPLHLCALLDLGAAAAALMNEACKDGTPVVPNEFPRAQRQAMLSAVCVQAWATVETAGDAEKEPWLWRDVTPLHLAILQKHYDVAELLIDVSSAETLGKLCVSRDVSGDSERSFSALLLAYEQNEKGLHRRIAKRFPTC